MCANRSDTCSHWASPSPRATTINGSRRARPTTERFAARRRSSRRRAPLRACADWRAGRGARVARALRCGHERAQSRSCARSDKKKNVARQCRAERSGDSQRATFTCRAASLCDAAKHRSGHVLRAQVRHELVEERTARDKTHPRARAKHDGLLGAAAAADAAAEAPQRPSETCARSRKPPIVQESGAWKRTHNNATSH